MFNLLSTGKKGKRSGEKGQALILVLCLVALGSLLLTAMLGLMGSGSKTSRIYHRETAKNLAETQLEYIKSIEYNPLTTTYDTSAIPATAHYTASNVVYLGSDVNHFNPVRDNNIQKIVVTITGVGITYHLEGFKTR